MNPRDSGDRPPDPRPLHELHDLDAFRDAYRRALLGDTLPFWTRHAVDRKYGGFHVGIDRSGRVVDPNKSIWAQARITWLLATLHATVEPRDEWLALARHGIDFLRRHAPTPDGGAWFEVTREGRPLRRQDDVYAEAFLAMALAAWARASGETDAADESRRVFAALTARIDADRAGSSPHPRGSPGPRPKELGVPLILVTAGRTLRATIADDHAAAWIDRAIVEIRRDFWKPDHGVLLDRVAPDGSEIDGFEGRVVNGGQSFEVAWLLLEEAADRGGDRGLIALAIEVVDGTWERSWDPTRGGIRNFVDVRGLPPRDPVHDLRWWWPQCEAILATLLAHLATGETRHAERHRRVHAWTHARFPDPDHGEWFGYLDRDGAPLTTLKGDVWKGAFHVPRMQLLAWARLDERGSDRRRAIA